MADNNLIIYSDEEQIADLKANQNNFKLIEISKLNSNSIIPSSFTNILSKSQALSEDDFAILIRWLKPNGKLIIEKNPTKDCTTGSLVSNLKLNGFVNVNESLDQIVAFKPNYEVGSAVKLDFGVGNEQNGQKAVTKTWTIAADEDDDDAELIDDDELLDEEDMIKPDPSTLKVCETTKKRKACANCTCGLADELEQEAIENIKKNTQNAKSSCGNCYLGDAFRCASCPYLGMPAFKPGQKVVLDNLSDL